MADTASPYDSVEQAAQDLEMGEIRSTFRPVRPSPWTPVAVAIPALLCGGFILYLLTASGMIASLFGAFIIVTVLTNTADEANYGDLVRAPLFDRIDAWGPMLEEGVTRVHLPRVRAEISARRPVAFGPVTVTSHAVTIDRTEIPWGEISGVTVENGYLCVKRTGKLFTTSQQVSYIPNFLVLAALIREYTGASPT
ncbi:DUF6585 family protein [Nocardiopsis mangrovi]|uniref:DUF6585 family protein n=1 Tax=Nocardiopsis mangrovi TaxID=1179818 RepID=A0ABV9DY00_9ACTN